MLLLERTKLVVEGAGAVGVAALLAGRVDGDGPVLALLSGGNIDATLLMSVARHGLSAAGRYLVVATRVPDRPGELFKLLSLVTEARMNVIGVEHRREGRRHRRHRDGDRADARHARRGALRGAARRRCGAGATTSAPDLSPAAGRLRPALALPPWGRERPYLNAAAKPSRVGDVRAPKA